MEEISTRVQDLDNLTKTMVFRYVRQLDNLIWQQLNIALDLLDIIKKMAELIKEYETTQKKTLTEFNKKQEKMNNQLKKCQEEKQIDPKTILSVQRQIAECGKDIDKELAEGKKSLAKIWVDNREKVQKKTD